MKKLLLIAVCCLCLCGCSNNNNTNTQNEKDTNTEIEEEKRMCCMNFGGTMENESCNNILDESGYNICINKIDSNE